MTLLIAPVAIANEIRLKRSQHRGAFVIVEGRDDRLLYEKFFADPQHCRFVVAGNKERVCEIIRILDSDGFHGALGIVDADFDLLDGISVSSSNIIRGDCHDIEAMLVRSPAFDRLLREFGSEEKIKRFATKTGMDICSVLLTAASPLGCLRWHSLRSNLSLRFDGLQFSRFVHDRALSVDRIKLVTAVKNLSQRQDLDSNDLELTIREIQEAKHDLWQLCNGHGLVGMLSIALRKAIGSQSAIAVGVEAMERALRLAYEAADFAATELYQTIREWEQRNEPFRVLS
jgi:hypothetical protein